MSSASQENAVEAAEQLMCLSAPGVTQPPGTPLGPTRTNPQTATALLSAEGAALPPTGVSLGYVYDREGGRQRVRLELLQFIHLL